MRFFRSIWPLFAVVLALGSITACSSMSVDSRRNEQADFQKYKTYAWAPTETSAPDGGASARKGLFDQTIKQAADHELAMKGLKKTDPDQADLLVSYWGTTRDRMVFRSVPAPHGLSAPTIDTGAEGYREGTLAVDLIDRASGEIVWEGVASDAIYDSGATDDQVRDATTEIIRKYPSA